MSEVFCDAVGVTVPEVDWAGLHGDISPTFDAAGLAVEFRDDRTVLWRHAPSSGTVRAFQRSGVWAIQCSGQVCAALRAVGMFAQYLASLGERPHRVTRLDASLDVPADAAPVVRDLALIGQQGGLRLTRKGIPPGKVTTLLGVRDDGVVSGTLYAGSRSAEARMVVYDKTKERQDRGVPVDGFITRYELRLKSGMGVTLRDVAEPAPVFWHHAAPSFLPLPSGVPPWSPHAEGFVLDRAPPMPPAARMRARVSASPEIAALIALAREPHSGGVDYLVHLVRARFDADSPPLPH